MKIDEGCINHNAVRLIEGYTFCSNRKCENKECMRHLESENARAYPPYRPMYVADFKDKCERRTKENE